MIVARVITKAAGVLATIILARLLSPEAFGLVAVGIISVNILTVFTEIGIKQALIKETSENTEKFLNTALTVELIRGLIIFVLVFIAAPYMVAFFNQPEAVNIVRVMALVPLFNGLTNIKIIYLQKELEFNKQFIYEISPLFGSLFVAVPLALILQNVWAIVIGTVASELLRVILSYYLIPYKPKLELNVGYFKQMFGFGKWIFASTIVTYFAMELDTYFAAKFLDARLLGIYTLAFIISTKPIIEVGKALTKVLFPAFAKINKDFERVRKAFFKSSTVLSLILVPLSIGLFLIAESFVTVFLGVKWFEMIVPLKILTIATLFRSFRLVSSGIFNGMGKPDLVFKQSIVRMLSLVICLCIFLLQDQLTLISIAIAVLISSFITLVYFCYVLFKLININAMGLFKHYYPIILATLFMSLIVSLLDYIHINKYIDFFMILIFGTCSYVFIILVFKSQLLLKKILNEFL